MYSEKPNINGGTTSFVTVGNNDVNKRARVSEQLMDSYDTILLKVLLRIRYDYKCQ